MNPDKIKNAKWYKQDIGEALTLLESHHDGLDKDEARERQFRFGLNKFSSVKKRTAFERFVSQFNNVLIYILLVAAVITSLLEHWIDTWVIVAVVFVNAVIGFIQEGKAEKALDEIRKMLTTRAEVIRNGIRMQINSEQLVPGDIVLLESGDKVPADLRLIDVKNLRIDESILTGESEAVTKSLQPISDEVVLGDQLCMAFSGTLVNYGRAKGVVTSTGINTEIGKISEMIADVEKVTTPLLRQIEKFGKKLSVFIITFSVALFIFTYLFRDYSIDEIFLAIIGLTVAAIPEGLPAIITITLAIGVQRMARKNAIIRQLPGVEGLGAVTVICSDKTGTLTRNEMTVRTIITPSNIYSVDGTGYEPKGNFYLNGQTVLPEAYDELMQITQAAMLCSEAEIVENENGVWELNGDPTEGALIATGLKAGINKTDYIRRDIIPFESETKFMATLHFNNSGEGFIYVKGAPEKILEMCQNGNGHIDLEYWKQYMDLTASKGERLIAVAMKKVEPEQTSINLVDLELGLDFLGIIGMKDSPRPEVAESIKVCRQAGIKVIMITGDHLLTARAIAEELGMETDGLAVVGTDLEQMTDEELRQLVKDCRIFARTSPAHKLRLVTALQENGEVVAMTGDGVNDAPALKRADVGVAMGIKGTEVSKDSAQMVLTDDNFASITKAVEEGRTVYSNIRKAILFIMPTNGAEVFVVFAAILLGMVLPITPVQILWVNMVTAVTLALALAFEPNEAGVMSRPPRNPQEPILGVYFIWRILFVSLLMGSLTLGLFFLAIQNGMDIGVSRTIAVNTLVAGEAFYLWNCRYMRNSALSISGITGNKYVLIAVFCLIILQLLFTYTPWMNSWFGTSPIGFIHWLGIIFAGLCVFLLVEFEKYVYRKYA